MAQPKVAAVDIPLKRTSGLPPEGMYRLVVAKTDLKDGPTGYPYISLECVIDNAAKKKTDKAAIWNGRTVYTNLSLSPQARWKMEEALDAIGAPEEGTLSDIGWFIGKRYYAWLSHHEWEGRKRLQVGEFIPQDDVRERWAAYQKLVKEREAEEADAKVAKAKQAEELTPEATEDELEELDAAIEADEDEEDLDAILDDLWLDDEDEDGE